MRATVVGLVTPHLLRVVDLANEAEKGVNVDWHLRDAVAKTMGELGDQHNAPALVASYIEGLEAARDVIEGDPDLLSEQRLLHEGVIGRVGIGVLPQLLELVPAGFGLGGAEFGHHRPGVGRHEKALEETVLQPVGAAGAGAEDEVRRSSR